MSDEMVMRSVYLRPLQDAQLRNLAHELGTTKSDLIRSAISIKLLEWLRTNDADAIRRDIEHGRRDESAVRSGRRRRQAGAATATPATKPTAKPRAPSQKQASGADGAAQAIIRTEEHV